MLTAFFNIGVLFLLFVPGVWVAHHKQQLNLKFLRNFFLWNFVFFLVLGLFCKSWPWLIELKL